jgi:hypothetical protein
MLLSNCQCLKMYSKIFYVKKAFKEKHWGERWTEQSEFLGQMGSLLRSTGVLNVWATDTHCDLRNHNGTNRGRIRGCRNMWHGNICHHEWVTTTDGPPCEFWGMSGTMNIYQWYERHMQYHDIDCTLFSFCSAMEAHGYPGRGVITAVRWVEATLVTTGCVWKCKPLPSSRSETHVSSASYSYHDAV